MGTISIRIMTHDRSRCAEVTLPDSLTIGELVGECRKRWQLDPSEIFAVRDMSTNKRLDEEQPLLASGISSGTELQLFPLVEGGGA